MNNYSLFLVIAVAIIALIDFIPRLFISRKRNKKVETSYQRVPSYYILPTVYGDIKYLKNIDFLKKYRNNVIVLTSKYESEEFYKALRKLCKQNGLRYRRVELPFANGKPLKSPYTIYRGALVQNVIGSNQDTPCILIDADTYAEDNVNNLVRAFVRSGYDIASLRCEVSNPRTVIEKLQEFEYKLSMDGRNMDPWLTSGACSIAKFSIYRHVFSRHSNFFAGGDIEIGKIAQIIGYKIGHLDFTFYTAAPDNFRDWFNQRIIWFSGGIRHHIANMHSFGWLHFFLLFYNSLLIYLLLPLRWLEFIMMPALVPLVIMFSFLYIFILVGWKKWKSIYLLLPFYSFIQTMIIIPLAFVRYIKLVRLQGSLGIIKHDLSKYTLKKKILFKSLNFASATVVVLLAVAFTTDRVDHWMDVKYRNDNIISAGESSYVQR